MGAPAVRAAVKTVIQNNPGFATSYIVNQVIHPLKNFENANPFSLTFYNLLLVISYLLPRYAFVTLPYSFCLSLMFCAKNIVGTKELISLTIFLNAISLLLCFFRC